MTYELHLCKAFGLIFLKYWNFESRLEAIF